MMTETRETRTRRSSFRTPYGKYIFATIGIIIIVLIGLFAIDHQTTINKETEIAREINADLKKQYKHKVTSTSVISFSQNKYIKEPHNEIRIIITDHQLKKTWKDEYNQLVERNYNYKMASNDLQNLSQPKNTQKNCQMIVMKFHWDTWMAKILLF